MTAARAASTAPRRPPLANRFMVRLLGSRLHHLASGRLAVLRYTARSGAPVALPVQVARDGSGVVVRPGNAARKQWWRHFRAAAPVEVLLDRHWYSGTGRVVTGADEAAAAAYRRTFPHQAMPADAVLVTVTLPGSATARPQLRGRPLRRAWFWTVTVAEFAGFAVSACVGALSADARPSLAVPALLAAGAVEGSMLGWGQVSVLRRALTGLRRRGWVIATAAAAVLAYALGLAPSTFAASLRSWPLAVVVPGAVVLGAALLASIGTAQWLILRRHVAGATGWIWATALAWVVGLGVFLGFAMPLWQPGQPLALTILIGIGGGLLMAATTSAITGVALSRLLAARPGRPTHPTTP